MRYILGFYIIFIQALCMSGQGKFIPNLGQWEDKVVSRAEISGGTLFLCKDQFRYNFADGRDLKVMHADPFIDSFTVHGQAFFVQFQKSNPKVEITSKNIYPEIYNYYLGQDPAHWKAGVHAYSHVDYKNLYPGIDLGIDADGPDLKYTYSIAPKTNVSALKLLISGAEGVFIKDGDLHIYSPIAEIVEKSPYAYQYIGEAKVEVPCNYKLTGNMLSFDFPKGYDKSKALVIDPLVIFATYSGSLADNFGFTATYDKYGNAYSGGDVYAQGFPVDSGAYSYQKKWAGGTDFFTNSTDRQVYGFDARDVGILKYTPDGKDLIYATYIGGKKGNEQPHSMVVDKAGNLVIIGTTSSSDFPVTSSAYQNTMKGRTDIFVCKLSPNGGSLLASTFMGGKDFDGVNGTDTFHQTASGQIIPDARTKLVYNYGDQFRGDVITDNNDNVYVASSTLSTDFPTTSGSYQPGFGGGKQDGCVFKIDSNLENLVWSTYIGGGKDDGAYSIQLDSENNVFVAGGTLSSYFFPKGQSYQPYIAGDVDGYICHLSKDGSTVIRATYFGTISYDQIYFVQLDKSENVYVYGQTESPNFLIKDVNYSVKKSGNFVTKFDNGLDSVIYSSTFGSGKSLPDVSPTAFLIDKCEKIYISGWGGELYYPSLSRIRKISGMPVTSDAFQSTTVDHSDFYVSVFEKNMDTVLYASYFGGPHSEEHVDGGTSRFDKNGIIYQSVCGGCGGNSDFPTTKGAWSQINRSVVPQANCNNLLFKVDLQIPTLKAGFIAPSLGCMNVTLSFANVSKKAKSYVWDFGDGSPVSTADTPRHFYKIPGNYDIKLIAYNPNSCEVYDTFRSKVTIYKNAKADFTVKKDSCSLNVSFKQTGTSTSTSWDFGDGAHSTAYDGQHTYAQPGTYLVKLLVDSGTECVDTFKKTIVIKGIHADFSYDYKPCVPQYITFKNLSTGALKSYKWWLPFATTDTAQNPSFNFINKGSYSVSLVVKDSFGCKDSTEKTIAISTKPKADFTIKVDSCTLLATFKNTSISTKNIHWLLGDGAESELDSVVHTYKHDSTYKITLIADPDEPCADTLTKTITFAPVKASYDYAIDTCSGEVHFTDKSTDAKSYLWQFTPTDTSTLKNPVFTFNEKGQYKVKLVSKSGAGCIDSFSQTVSITRDANRKLRIPNVFTPNGDPHNNKFVVDGLSPCYISEIWIYNRWGQELFHQKGTTLTWDGYVDKVLLPEGAYYYVFKGHTEGTLEGTISVVY